MTWERIVSQTLSAYRPSVGEARSLVRAALADLPETARDDAVQCASELAANAVEHSRSSIFRLNVFVSERAVRIEVVDDGTEGTPEVVMAPADATRQRGLWIVSKIGNLEFQHDGGACRAVVELAYEPVTLAGDERRAASPS
jgi:anti-sigma regulatory factor (Ser/Thr protein kinase)